MWWLHATRPSDKGCVRLVAWLVPGRLLWAGSTLTPQAPAAAAAASSRPAAAPPLREAITSYEAALDDL